MKTLQAADALSRIPKNLEARRLGLGIGTPPATERTPLKKYHGPDARSVMDAEFLKIKKSTPDFHNYLIPPYHKYKQLNYKRK
jgi:hypothetical protein